MDDPTAHEMYRYRLFLDANAHDLSVLDHPAPNLEADDEVVLEDGRRYRVVSYVPAPPEAPIHRILTLEPVEDE